MRWSPGQYCLNQEVCDWPCWRPFLASRSVKTWQHSLTVDFCCCFLQLSYIISNSVRSVLVECNPLNFHRLSLSLLLTVCFHSLFHCSSLPSSLTYCLSFSHCLSISAFLFRVFMPCSSLHPLFKSFLVIKIRCSLSSFIAERNAERQYALLQNYIVWLGKYKVK